MRTLLRLTIMLCFSFPAFAQNYGPDSPTLTENPISQGGTWVNGATTGIDWGDVQTTPGFFFGDKESAGCSGGSPTLCTDSTAVVTGTWSPNQAVQTVVKVNTVTSTVGREVEDRLLTTITAHSIKGYEINYSCATSTLYFQLVRWNGALGSFDQLDQGNPSTACTTGDVMTARSSVSGGTVIITFAINGVAQTFTNCSCTNPHDSSTTPGHSAILTGNPGIGFFDSLDTNFNDAGFSSFWAANEIANTCGETDVLNAFALAADGDTLAIPAGTCTWTTNIAPTLPGSMVILGAGSQTTTGGGDVTVINDSLTGSGNYALSLTIPSGKTLRVSGFTMQAGSRTIADHGTIGFECNNTANELRVDHFHLKNISTAMTVGDCFGVMDHSVADELTNNANWLHVWNPNYNKGASAGEGDGSWASATQFGTGNFFYMEANTINVGTDDCTFGGRAVARFNTMTGGASWQTHPTGGGGADERGCRAYEIYDNTATTGGGQFNFFFESSGGAIVFNNSTGNTYQNFVTLHSMRRQGNSSCGGTGTYCQAATPTGWGYCGTSFNGTGSAWDGNSPSTSGNRCIDQPGNGIGDLITGTAPSQVNQTTGIISTLNQALDPVYIVNNTWTTSGGGGYSGVNSSAEAQVLINNTNYYYDCASAFSNPSCTSFTGAFGTGAGARSSRPSNCTTGVGWLSTDQGPLGVMDECTSTNTWTNAVYTPFTCPHPLDTTGISGCSGSTPPPPAPSPTNFVWNGSVSKSVPITLTGTDAISIPVGTFNLTGSKAISLSGSATASLAVTCTCSVPGGKISCSCSAK